MIRIRIAEELDAPHRAHAAALEAEIEKFRNSYFSTRRELELLKAKLEAQQVFILHYTYIFLVINLFIIDRIEGYIDRSYS